MHMLSISRSTKAYKTLNMHAPGKQFFFVLFKCKTTKKFRQGDSKLWNRLGHYRLFCFFVFYRRTLSERFGDCEWQHQYRQQHFPRMQMLQFIKSCTWFLSFVPILIYVFYAICAQLFITDLLTAFLSFSIVFLKLQNFFDFKPAAKLGKRSVILEDIVFVTNGSGSDPGCKFRQGLRAFTQVIKMCETPRGGEIYGCRHAAVTYSSLAINSWFLMSSFCLSKSETQLNLISWWQYKHASRSHLKWAKYLFLLY